MRWREDDRTSPAGQRCSFVGTRAALSSTAVDEADKLEKHHGDPIRIHPNAIFLSLRTEFFRRCHAGLELFV